MRRTSIFNYYVPTSEDVYAACKDWKLSFDNCRNAWETISVGVCDTYNADGYKLKNFMVPRFKFDAGAPSGWRRHPDGLFSPPNNVADIAFAGLPTPENFNSVCYEAGFPDLNPSDLQYWLIWTPKGRLILSVPNEELLEANGIVFNQTQQSFFQDNFTQISEARYKYWVSKEFLELNDEIPD